MNRRRIPPGLELVGEQSADRKIGALAVARIPERSNAVPFQKTRPLSNGRGIRPEPTQTCPTERRLFSVTQQCSDMRHGNFRVSQKLGGARFANRIQDVLETRAGSFQFSL